MRTFWTSSVRCKTNLYENSIEVFFFIAFTQIVTVFYETAVFELYMFFFYVASLHYLYFHILLNT